jgi:group I intron endonuclease
MRQGSIYLITNMINDKKYVGQTVTSVNKRWLAHIQESKTYSDRPLYRAINKHGVENFKIKVLEECTEDKLSEREVYWISFLDTYNKGYNATTGGERNSVLREDVKEKISESMSNLERSDEWVNNVSKGLKDKFERGERWGFMLYKNEGGKHLRRRIEGTNIITGEVIEFESITEAVIKVNGKSGNISRAIKDGYISYGYKWRKVDNKPIKRAVVGYDKKTGELLYEYESIQKASMDIRNKRGSGILRSLKNPGKNTWMGCYWYYA